MRNFVRRHQGFFYLCGGWKKAPIHSRDMLKFCLLLSCNKCGKYGGLKYSKKKLYRYIAPKAGYRIEDAGSTTKNAEEKNEGRMDGIFSTRFLRS
jgi:ssDNA-binding Zn-finger/Zn-ribbon topoisomerase 1